MYKRQALEAVRNGENPELTTRQKHTRECFVVLEDGADAAKVEEDVYKRQILYDTEAAIKKDPVL